MSCDVFVAYLKEKNLESYEIIQIKGYMLTRSEPSHNSLINSKFIKEHLIGKNTADTFIPSWS